MWGEPFPGRGLYEDWRYLKVLTTCWRERCEERVDRDGIGLCPTHLEEMRSWESIPGKKLG